jgi:hypothetical protein
MTATETDFPPKRGAFCIAYGDGPWLWLETTSNTAREARQRMGNIMAGIHRHAKDATPEQGWKYARKQGYRVVKVDIFPHGAQP